MRTSKIITIKQRLAELNQDERSNREEVHETINHPGSSNQTVLNHLVELNPHSETNCQHTTLNENKVTSLHLSGPSGQSTPNLKRTLGSSTNLNSNPNVSQHMLNQQPLQINHPDLPTRFNLSDNALNHTMAPTKYIENELCCQSDLSFEPEPSSWSETSCLTQSTSIFESLQQPIKYVYKAVRCYQNPSRSRCNPNPQPASNSQISQLAYCRDVESIQKHESSRQSEQDFNCLSKPSQVNVKSGSLLRSDDLNVSEKENDINAKLQSQNVLKPLSNIQINQYENWNANKEKCRVKKTYTSSTHKTHADSLSQTDQELNQTSVRNENDNSVSQEKQYVYAFDNGSSKKMKISKSNQQRNSYESHQINRDTQLQFVQQEPSIVNITIHGNIIHRIREYPNMSRSITKSDGDTQNERQLDSIQQPLSASNNGMFNQNKIVDSSSPSSASALELLDNETNISVPSTSKLIENDQREDFLNVRHKTSDFSNIKSTDDKSVQTDPVDIEEFGTISLAYNTFLALYESLKQKCIKYSYIPDMKRLASSLIKYTELVNNFKEYNRKKTLLQILYTEDVFDEKIQAIEENANEVNNKEKEHTVKIRNDIKINIDKSFRIKLTNLCYGLLKCLRENEKDIVMWAEIAKDIESKNNLQENRLIEVNDENLEKLSAYLSNKLYVTRVIELPALFEHKCDETRIDNDDQYLSMIFKEDFSNDNIQFTKGVEEAKLSLVVTNESQPKESRVEVSDDRNDESKSDETSEAATDSDSYTDSSSSESDEENVNINNDNSSLTPDSVCKPSSSNCEDMTIIGSGHTVVPTVLFNDINWCSYTHATRTLLEAIFPRIVLATHNLSGKQSPAFKNKPAKPRLDERTVNDIIQTVLQRCKTTKQQVRQAITTKCCDEAKLYRARLVRRKSRHKQKENKNNNVL